MKGIIAWIVVLMIWLLIANGDPSGWEKEAEIISQAPLHFIAASIAFFVVVVLPASIFGWSITSHITRKNLEAEYAGEIKILKATIEASGKDNKRLETKITELEKQLSSGTDLSQNLEEDKNQYSLKIRAYLMAKR
ncbi:MAG: hypothetical protein ACRCVT_15310, partial [Leadbetterella sp.]